MSEADGGRGWVPASRRAQWAGAVLIALVCALWGLVIPALAGDPGPAAASPAAVLTAPAATGAGDRP